MNHRRQTWRSLILLGAFASVTFAFCVHSIRSFYRLIPKHSRWFHVGNFRASKFQQFSPMFNKGTPSGRGYTHAAVGMDKRSAFMHCSVTMAPRRASRSENERLFALSGVETPHLHPGRYPVRQILTAGCQKCSAVAYEFEFQHSCSHCVNVIQNHTK